jgi:hypothetical protein
VWSVHELGALLAHRYGVKVSTATVHRALLELGYRYRRPWRSTLPVWAPGWETIVLPGPGNRRSSPYAACHFGYLNLLALSFLVTMKRRRILSDER